MAVRVSRCAQWLECMRWSLVVRGGSRFALCLVAWARGAVSHGAWRCLIMSRGSWGGYLPWFGLGCVGVLLVLLLFLVAVCVFCFNTRSRGLPRVFCGRLWCRFVNVGVCCGGCVPVFVYLWWYVGVCYVRCGLAACVCLFTVCVVYCEVAAAFVCLCSRGCVSRACACRGRVCV